MKSLAIGRAGMKKITKKKAATIGSAFDSFLKQDGIYEEVTTRAIERVLARQFDDLVSEKPVGQIDPKA